MAHPFPFTGEPMGWGRGVWVVRHPCPNGELLSHGMGRLPIAPLVGQSTAQLFGQGWRTTKQQHNYNCPAQVWTKTAPLSRCGPKQYR